MTKELWINLPVKDVKKSKEFFIKLGFFFNAKHGDDHHSACLIIGEKNIAVMLFDEQTFKSFTNNEIADAKKTTETLFSFDVESREEVDEMAKKVIDAGGIINNEAKEIQGWLYGFVFRDLDGHCWNVLYMDMSKAPL